MKKKFIAGLIIFALIYSAGGTLILNYEGFWQTIGVGMQAGCIGILFGKLFGKGLK